MTEDTNSQETGMFVNVQAKDTGHRVPSDGVPFSKYLSMSAGAKPSQGGDMGGGPGAMFMKKMKKLMAKKMAKK